MLLPIGTQALLLYKNACAGKYWMAIQKKNSDLRKQQSILLELRCHACSAYNLGWPMGDELFPVSKQDISPIKSNQATFLSYLLTYAYGQQDPRMPRYSKTNSSAYREDHFMQGTEISLLLNAGG